MKLGTLKDGSRDGTLVVVNRDLSQAVRAPHIAPTLQAALDRWSTAEPELRQLFDELQAGRCSKAFPLDVRQLAAPLPRAYSWIDGSVYLNHMELARKLRGAEMPPAYREEPLMYDGASIFLAATDPIRMTSESDGIDLEGEIGLILRDTPVGTPASQAADCIALVTLVNDISLRAIIRRDLERGFGIYHGKPPCSMAPVAVTLDELGEAWDGGKVRLPIQCHVRGEWIGAPNAGDDMFFDFPTLIAAAARNRQLLPGTVLGSGTVSNFDRSRGSACLVEKIMIELTETGAVKTSLLRFGDSLKIEMLLPNGQSVCGAIEQVVERA